MPNLFFADNTVLINFALIDRLDLLEALLNARGRWCLTVSQECRRSSQQPGLTALAGVGAFLGPPIPPDSPAELLFTQVLRDRLVSPFDGPRKSLGEAETLAIMHARFRGDILASDDKGAARLAADRQLDLGVKVATTADLLRLALRAGKLTQQEHDLYVGSLRSRGRFIGS